MSDILKPNLHWIEGRCYRVEEALQTISSYQEEELSGSEMGYGDLDEGEDPIEVTQLESGRFTSTVHVANPYIGALIGTKGSVKRRLESETRAEIKIPKMGQTGDVTVFGSTAASVKLAVRRINLIVLSSRSKKRPTHFISIPMNCTAIKEKFEEFKKGVLEAQPELKPELFTAPEKLHLTLDVMCLMDDHERLIAGKLLNEAKINILVPILNDVRLRILMKGVSYMNDDPKAVTVLYAEVEEADENCKGLLQRICDDVVELFARAGFVKQRNNHVKMHVTLMNSRYLYKKAEIRNQPYETFDTSKILEDYSNYEFGIQDFSCLHLSILGSSEDDATNTTYYQPSCVVDVSNEASQ